MKKGSKNSIILFLLFVFLSFPLTNTKGAKLDESKEQKSIAIAYTTNTWGQVDPCPA